MYKYLFTIYLIVNIGLINGQTQSATIKGKIVFNNLNDENIVNTVIHVLNTNQNFKPQKSGDFIIENLPFARYRIQISHLGIIKKTVDVTINESKTYLLNINISEDTFELGEFYVNAKSKARKLREGAMPISVISIDQLKGTVTSVNDVLRKTVGVTIRNSGGIGSSSRLSVRGLEGKRIGFFIDEIPLNDQSDFIELNDIPVDMLDRIEIYKGVVPAKFGGTAMGGAVNIVLKEYPETYADFSYLIESFNTHKIQTVVKNNLVEQGLTFGFGGIYTYSDNNYKMSPPNLKNENFIVRRNHDTFKKLAVGGSFSAKKWWFDDIVLEPLFIDSYREIQGVEIDIKEAFIESQALVLNNTIEKENFFIKGLDLDMTSILAHTQYNLVDTAKVYYDWYGNKYPTLSTFGGELGNGFASLSNNKKLNFSNKLNLLFNINEQHTINYNSYLNLAKGSPKDDIRKKSLGGETLFDTNMASLVVGLTYDFRTQDEKFLNAFTTRYYHYTMNTKTSDIYTHKDIKDIRLNKNTWGFNDALRYKFSQDLIGKLAVGYDVRIPSESELLGDGLNITPSEKLLPETNRSLNAGLLYDLTGKSKSNLQIDLNGFYMHITDMIRYVNGFLGAQYQNFGEMRIKGLEFETKGDILPFLYAYGNITYQDLRDVRKYRQNSTVANPTKDKRMPNIPYLLANTGIEFHKENLFGGKSQNTRIFLDFSFIEEYYYDFEMTANQRKIPRSCVLDVGFEHSLFNRQLFISGKIKNIGDAIVLSEFNRPLPGRSFGVKLRYLFLSKQK